MTVCFMGGMLLSAKAENISVDMLNKKGKERMAYSEDVVRVAIGDTVTWEPTEKGHNVQFIAGPDGWKLPKKSKINKVVSYIRNKGADFHFISASENNAWLLNIRGKDSDYSPIPDSYILIDKHKKVNFFCDFRKISLSLSLIHI